MEWVEKFSVKKIGDIYFCVGNIIVYNIETTIYVRNLDEDEIVKIIEIKKKFCNFSVNNTGTKIVIDFNFSFQVWNLLDGTREFGRKYENKIASVRFDSKYGKKILVELKRNKFEIFEEDYSLIKIYDKVKYSEYHKEYLDFFIIEEDDESTTRIFYENSEIIVSKKNDLQEKEINDYFLHAEGNFCRKIDKNYLLAKISTDELDKAWDARKEQKLAIFGKHIKSAYYFGHYDVNILLRLDHYQDLTFSAEKKLIWQIDNNRLKTYSFKSEIIQTDFELVTERDIGGCKISDDGTWVVGWNFRRCYFFHKEPKSDSVAKIGKLFLVRSLNTGTFKVIDSENNFKLYNEEILFELFPTIKNFSEEKSSRPFLFTQGSIETFQTFCLHCISSEEFTPEDLILKEYLDFN